MILKVIILETVLILSAVFQFVCIWYLTRAVRAINEAIRAHTETFIAQHEINETVQREIQMIGSRK